MKRYVITGFLGAVLVFNSGCSFLTFGAGSGTVFLTKWVVKKVVEKRKEKPGTALYKLDARIKELKEEIKSKRQERKQVKEDRRENLNIKIEKLLEELKSKKAERKIKRQERKEKRQERRKKRQDETTTDVSDLEEELKDEKL